MYVLKSACKSSLLFILFYQVSCFLGNYICAMLYNEWCVNIWSYNSPICIMLLYFLAGISILYTYIWYICGCSIFVFITRNILTFTEKI